jgi:hypothetical protein
MWDNKMEDIIREKLHYAGEELKRAEHLLYVSLKYTRTVDVMKSLVDRLITCFDILIEGLLEQKEKENIIFDIPKAPFARVEVLRSIYQDNKQMINYLDFYTMLRKLSRSPHTAICEFRRNVTMIAKVDDISVEVNIDISGDYFYKTVDFLRFIKELFLNKTK